jgi:hypothetical protein
VDEIKNRGEGEQRRRGEGFFSPSPFLPYPLSKKFVTK